MSDWNHFTLPLKRFYWHNFFCLCIVAVRSLSIWYCISWTKHVLHLNMYFTDQNIMQTRDLMKPNFEGLEMQKWNIPKDRAQRVDEKKRAICLINMFSPRVIVIRMSKMAHFLSFLLMTAKNQSQFGQNILEHLKDVF